MSRWSSPGRCVACKNFRCVSPKVDDIEHLPAAEWEKPFCYCGCHDTACKDCGAIGGHYCVGPAPKAIDTDLVIRAAVALKVKCDKHPKYEAKRRPRTACEWCWRRWIAKNP